MAQTIAPKQNAIDVQHVLNQYEAHAKAIQATGFLKTGERRGKEKQAHNQEQSMTKHYSSWDNSTDSIVTSVFVPPPKNA